MQASSGTVVTALTILLLTGAGAWAQIVNQGNPVCKGVFDFYFVLDSSGSVGEHFHSEIVPFVKNVTDHYTNPNFRVSFISFATDSVVHLSLTRTGEREEILAGIERLQNFKSNGATNLAPGLREVNSQIAGSGGDTASVILVLTDGKLDDPEDALQQADVSRHSGGSVVAIGVGNSDRSQLEQIADSANHVYIGSDFEYLTQIINRVVNETCIEIVSVFPAQVCIHSTERLVLQGRGFTNQLNPQQASCRFKTGSGLTLTTRIHGNITYNRLSCTVPSFNHSDIVVVQISTNGISFISSNVTMEISTCQADLSVVAGVFGTLLFLLAILTLFLLWFFCPLITCTMVGGKAKEKRKPPPRPRAPQAGPIKKWEVVDASYYGGRGAGGITPMKVKWGDKGATEEGNKLEKAKDASVVKVERRAAAPPPRPPPPSHSRTSTSGCWGNTKRRLSRWYAVASSYRPVFTVHGSKKKILWSPRSSQQNTAILV